MAAAQTYQSEFTGSQMDARFRAVATLAEALTVLEQAIAAKYTKPADGIPSTDMDASVQSALALALTSVQSLADYYTKSQVDSIAAAIAATINATSGEVVASLPTASASTLGKIYYVGPTSGEYDRYVTSYDGTTYSWLQIGTTDVDMTQYATVDELNQLGQKVDDNNYVRAYVDKYGRVLWGIKADGSIEWWKGIPTPIAEALAELASTGDERFTDFLTKWEQVNEKMLMVKLADVEFGKSDFGNYNIAQNGNIYSSTSVLSTQAFFDIASRKISFSINPGYRAILSFYTSDHTMVVKTTPVLANSGIYEIAEPSASCFRISIKKTDGGTITVDDYDAAGLTLAFMQEELDSNYEMRRVLLPIYPPVPQKPADGTSNSDFNAETVTVSDILSACDAAILPNPRYASSTILGKDSSGEYDIKAYTLTRRNRFAYKAAPALYAWKNGNTIVYAESCSPVVGATLYNSSHISIGETIASFDSATETITDSSSVIYTRAASNDVAADIFWARYITDNYLASAIYAFDKDGVFMWQELGDFRGGANVTHGGKTYVRSPEYDFHTDNLYNVVIWGNEHGPQSDPMEPSIIICRMIEDLVGATGKTNKMLSFIKNYCKVTFVPCANPYGCDNHTRNNYNNVNINRNYPTKDWASATENKGAYAGSEPETQILMNLVFDMDADVVIDSHCLGYVSDGGGENNTGKLVMETPYADRLYLDRISAITELEYGLAVEEFDNDTAGLAPAWLKENGIVGGVSEMNAGKYGGAIHSANILEADYFYLLNVLRMLLNNFDKAFRLDNYVTEII